MPLDRACYSDGVSVDEFDVNSKKKTAESKPNSN